MPFSSKLPIKHSQLSRWQWSFQWHGKMQATGYTQTRAPSPVQFLIGPACCFSSVSSYSRSWFYYQFSSESTGDGPMLLLFLGQETLHSESRARKHGEEVSVTPQWQRMRGPYGILYVAKLKFYFVEFEMEILKLKHGIHWWTSNAKTLFKKNTMGGFVLPDIKHIIKLQ